MKKARTKQTSTLSPVAVESIADLAVGTADDFNNILTTIMGACSLIDRENLSQAELVKCVALILASAERAARLSNTLMLVATEGRPKKSNLDT